ncbi:MAG: putative restriction endonuclease [Actinomycetota bacterium]|nr:putative restriction endonuclease [Actinomycetota bacterium]
MQPDERDRLVRLSAFTWLARQIELRGEVLPISVLREGFVYNDRRVPLMGPQGIFKPAVLPDAPLSITTVPVVEGRDRPYDDEMGPDGFLRYRYRGTNPSHHDNVGLRRAMERQLPLVYLFGTAPGWYRPEWPVFIVGDDPAALSFTVAMDDPQVLRPDLTVDVVDEARRSYITRLTRHRLHQLAFRQRVLLAYRESCAMCRLNHVELLDAAHILPDGHPRGDPVVTNGMAMCKLHHAAFDRHIVGIRPDLVVEVRHDILEEVDGPMLRHGLQDLQGRKLLVLPFRRIQHPDPESLAERYELFRSAG